MKRLPRHIVKQQKQGSKQFVEYAIMVVKTSKEIKYIHMHVYAQNIS